jgi:hypothetical protein
VEEGTDANRGVVERARRVVRAGRSQSGGSMASIALNHTREPSDAMELGGHDRGLESKD